MTGRQHKDPAHGSGKGALGVFGGMFDPVHEGHMHLASTLAEKLDLPEVRVLPCASPPHRAAPVASVEDRCNMLQLALAGHPRLKLDRRELQRHGTCYTIDTISSFRHEGYAPLYLFLGGDSLAGFCSWRDWPGILRLANLVVAKRPGSDAGLPPALEEYLCADLHRLRHCAYGCVHLLSIEAPEASSTLIRAGSNTFLPPAIASYIHDHGLYADGGRNQM